MNWVEGLSGEQDIWWTKEKIKGLEGTDSITWTGEGMKIDPNKEEIELL